MSKVKKILFICLVSHSQLWKLKLISNTKLTRQKKTSFWLTIQELGSHINKKYNAKSKSLMIISAYYTFLWSAIPVNPLDLYQNNILLIYRHANLFIILCKLDENGNWILWEKVFFQILLIYVKSTHKKKAQLLNNNSRARKSYQ